ncbi:MAG: hypothetical protein CFE28_07980 [Alphaproteobacteria bacterium PA2]|nr:MAG: hypothetical protein CFE28_07980 [Alphaproteobacteria bacterium PA2]
MPSPPSSSPPPGWRVFNDQLVPDQTVGGYLARGQSVSGACDQRDCRRRFWIDFDNLIRRGYAPFPVKELKALLLCRKPGGCAMGFKDSREGSGLTLKALSRFPQVRIRLRCTGCKWEKTITPDRAAAQLKAAGTGSGDTFHIDLLEKLSKPCAKCRQTAWACEVIWPQARPSWQGKTRSGPPLPDEKPGRDRRGSG